MAVPVINDTVSVLSLTRGRPFSLQLVVETGSSAASSWAIYRGALPYGLSLNTSTGLISGTPDRDSEGSVFVSQIRATNGDGNSTPLQLVWGIEAAEVDADGGAHAVIDLDTGLVGFPGTSQRDAKNRPVIHWRVGDAFPLTVTFVRAGLVVDLPNLSSLRVAGKRRDTEAAAVPFYDPEAEVWLRQGQGETARFLVWLDLTGAEIRRAVAEESADEGTAAPFLAEITWTWGVEMGGEEPMVATRSTLEFWAVIHSEITQ